ncbi:MAG: hypothetical protein IPM27_03150 [Nitrosomonadales bacterium]|nr:hypothetical protein [Nitrosomonadales bacterium]
MVRLSCLLMLAFCCAQAGAAPSDAAGLAAAMRQARLSDGFEVRMSVQVTGADKRLRPPFKIAVIGQTGSEWQRLLMRGISPNGIRNHFFAADNRSDGTFDAIEYDEHASGSTEYDPQAGLFDSGMVLWDMFAPWWNWTEQTIVGTDRTSGRQCELIRSRHANSISPVSEVVSCVDRKERLSVRTQLFDARHRLLRTITVERSVRKESGMLAAKKLSVIEADGRMTELEVYAGDEHYRITPATFARLDARTNERRRR